MLRVLTLKHIPLSQREPLQPKGSKGVGRPGHTVESSGGADPHAIHIEDTKYKYDLLRYSYCGCGSTPYIRGNFSFRYIECRPASLSLLSRVLVKLE